MHVVPHTSKNTVASNVAHLVAIGGRCGGTVPDGNVLARTLRLTIPARRPWCARRACHDARRIADVSACASLTCEYSSGCADGRGQASGPGWPRWGRSHYLALGRNTKYNAGPRRGAQHNGTNQRSRPRQPRARASWSIQNGANDVRVKKSKVMTCVNLLALNRAKNSNQPSAPALAANPTQPNTDSNVYQAKNGVSNNRGIHPAGPRAFKSSSDGGHCASWEAGVQSARKGSNANAPNATEPVKNGHAGTRLPLLPLGTISAA
mmetsp:Transcript_7226/g.45082  ORF Transcript_7226/g.45082 Transcript_7226/m.45082 type:complete len:264 (-) Transcript_7226:345-1136(-)